MIIIKNIFKHYIGTAKHRFWVARFLFIFSMRLFYRALTHDLSKYLPSEAKGFIKVIHKLEGSTYGSDEYRESLRSIKPSIDLHYKRNHHHPEHFKLEGIEGMNLVDVIEMWCDWKAAVRRHKNGDIEKSLMQNKDRFSMNELFEILFNQHIDEK